MELSSLHLDWGSSKYKGKTYCSYSLARALWVDGKNKKETVIKLGKLSDDQVKRWRTFLKAIKNPNYFFTSFEDICVMRHFAYLDVSVANAVWDELNLGDVFQDNGKRLISIATVARILTLNRNIEPASKSRTPIWFKKTALPWMLNVNPDQINQSRIFRELTVIEKYKDDICKYLFNKFTQTNPKSMSSLFYDLSSTSFEGTKCKLMKWGHCKGGYENHVVIALVVNKKGLPFYWEVLPGCTADSTTMIWLLERLKKLFSLDEITFVFDRGIVSDDNLALLEGDKIKYISAMDRNQIEKITDVNFMHFSNLSPNQIDEQIDNHSEFEKINSNTFGREIKVEENRRYILCFNPQLFKDQRKAREQAIIHYETFVNNLNNELLKAKISRQRKSTYNKFTKRLEKMKLNGFVDVLLSIKHIHVTDKNNHKKIRTYTGKTVINKEKMRLAGRLDGFWLLVTNHYKKEDNEFIIKTKDAIAPYREKEIIEEAFRDINSFIEIAPVFVWTEEHVKAYYTICVLSYLIDKTITLRLHKNKGNTSKEIVSHVRFFEELSGCRLDYIGVKNIGQNNFNFTTTTTQQKDLLKRVGLEHLLSRKLLDIANKSPNYAE